jgi:ribosome-binding protein aMBF1 (putative translation factor)
MDGTFGVPVRSVRDVTRPGCKDRRPLKKPPKTGAKRRAGPKRETEDAEPTNKPFAEQFREGRLSTAEVLGNNVKRLRTVLELSQADLAEAIGTDQSAIENSSGPTRRCGRSKCSRPFWKRPLWSF